jgi:hypothetical protein
MGLDSGWTLIPGNSIPGLRPVVVIAHRVHTATGPTRRP